MRDVFVTFFRLGVTSFGGPIAHLGYYRREFVERKAWLDEAAYAQIVAFCSVLPGPTSSQVGMMIGLLRAGPWGGLLAWLGFTLPSALAMALIGAALGTLAADDSGTPMWLVGLLAGLTAAAAAVVAQAVLAMAKTQCPDRETQTIAIGAAILAYGLQAAATLQWVPIVIGALVGASFMSRAASRPPMTAAALPLVVSKRIAAGAAIAFVAIIASVALLAPHSEVGTFAAIIMRAGTLVFGGGHVVLPLLQAVVSDGFLSSRDFFAGYGAVQAMPGPLFTFAAFLGEANLSPLRGALGAIVAVILIFVPSFLLVVALAPVWNAARALPGISGALRGASASVVGVLGAVLYSPIITNLGTSVTRVAIALAAFALVVVWKAPPWAVVVSAAVAGTAFALTGATI